MQVERVLLNISIKIFGRRLQQVFSCQFCQTFWNNFYALCRAPVIGWFFFVKICADQNNLYATKILALPFET